MGTKSVQSESVPQSAMVRRGTMTGVLSAAAGAPCAVQVRRGREGSFLVLVVGTLALLAVITIVYVALGNADTRTKAAAQSRVQQDDVAPKVGEYIASVIGDDVVATEFTGEVTGVIATSGQPGGANLRALLRRETSDAPGVRPDLSTQPGTPAAQIFDPVGTLPAQVQSALATNPASAAANPDNRIPASDPFLASMLPVNFNNEFARGQNGSSVVLQERPYLYDLDWLSISNFAPDGAFVNLENLRNNFRASSLDLRRNKTLYDVNGLATQDTVFDTPVDQNNPFHWTMYQQRAFQPGKLTSQWADADGDGMLDSRLFEMVDVFGGVGRRVTPSLSTANVRYFIAARAVDLSGMVNVTTATEFTTGTNNAFVAGATPADVDLRRLLTQADVYADQNPAGNPNALVGYQGLIQFPDPTDLGGASGARLDLPQNYALYNESSAFRAGSAAFAALRLSLATNTIVPRDVVGNPNIITLAEQDFQVTLDSSVLGAYGAQLKNFNPAQPAQLRALQAVFGAPFPATGNLPGAPAIATSDWAAMRQVAWNQSQKRLVGGAFNVTSTHDGALPGGLFTTSDLSELLTRFGVNSDERSALEIVLGGRDATQGQLTQRFDPLRSNRPESIEMIRFEVDPATGIDNAPALGSEQDRVMRLFGSDVRRLITPLNGARQFRSASSFVDSSSGNVESVDPERLQGNELKADLRAILDAGDPGDQGDVSALFRGYAAGLAPYSFLKDSWSRTQTGLRTATLSYGNRGPEAALLTAAHMAANLKDFADADTRPTAVTVPLTVEALNELGAASALPAATNPLAPLNNFAPWFEGIDSLGYIESRNEFETRRLLPEVDPANAEAKLADSNADVVAPAVNVYGIEPQIFITQVSTMTMYMDDPPQVPDVSRAVRIAPDFPNNAKSTLTNVIGSATPQQASNSELLARIIAFKVTNPFDRPVVLSEKPFADGSDPVRAPVASNAETLVPDRWANGTFMDISEYADLVSSSSAAVDKVRIDGLRDYQYIKVGQGDAARYFLLMGMVEQVRADGTYTPNFSAERDAPPITLEPIVVLPGESVLLYAMSEPPARIAERVDDRGGDWGVRNPGGIRRQEIREFVQEALTKQLGGGAGADEMRRYWVPLYAPIATARGGSTGVNVDTGLQNVDVFVDVIPADPPPASGPSATPTPPMAVSLWRADRRLPAERRELTPDWSRVTLTTPTGPQPNNATVGTLGPRETTTPPALVLAPNFVNNDILLDRFKLPTEQVLDSALPQPTANVVITGTNEVQHDGGLTIMLARTYRRPGDPGLDFAGGVTPAGVLPAYCIEPKYVTGTAARPQDSWTTAQPSRLLNRTLTPTLFAAAPTLQFRGNADGDFLGDPNNAPANTQYAGAFIEFSPRMATGLANDSRALVRDAWELPRNWTTQQMLANGENEAGAGFAYPGREFAVTHGTRATQAGALVGGALYRYYNEMYPSMLQAGTVSLVTPAAPATSDRLQSSMFRQERYDAAGVLQPQTLPDGQTVATISTLRLTDLLLPMGLGPMEMPVAAATSPWPGTTALNPDVYAEFQQRYTTLGEAVAIAMGYEANQPAATYDRDPALWLAPRDRGGNFILPVPAVPTAADAALRGDASDLLMFDAGQLAIDRFVPFLDLNGDGVAAVNEPNWGMGVPAAVNVLDQFTIISAPSGFDQPPLSGSAQQLRDFAARRTREQLTTAIPGLININTAPVQVLRTLPLASPAPTLKTSVAQADLIAGTVPPQNQWRTFDNGVNAWDNNPFLNWRVSVAGANTAPVVDQATDIAPTIAAVRDLYPERIRTDSAIFMAQRFAALGMPAGVQAQLITPAANIFDPIGTYGASGAEGLANRIVPAMWNWANTGLTAADVQQLWTRANLTRERSTGIAGIRSQPGFRSPAELLIARARWTDGAANVNIGAPNAAGATPTFRKEVTLGLPTNPDYLGFDQHLGAIPTDQQTRDISAAFRGLDPIQRHSLDTDLTPDGNLATSPNSTTKVNPRNLQQEKLIIPGAMMSAATTRSDVFAVWFTVYGFREGDVNTPAPAPGQDPAPLLPSIQRRFLMVIDRSNVTQLGEKPRIVLFKEVPM